MFARFARTARRAARHGIRVVSLVGPLAIASPANAIDSIAFEPGLQLFEQGEFVACAEEWRRLAEASLESGEELEHGALAYVLATRCYEAAGDPRAYETWGRAIRRYLEAGVTWDGVRQQVREDLEEHERRLALATVDAYDGGGTVSLDLVAAFRFRLDAVMSLWDYRGPGAGLGRGRVDQRADETDTHAVPVYVGSAYAEGTGAASPEDPKITRPRPSAGSVRWIAEEEVTAEGSAPAAAVRTEPEVPLAGRRLLEARPAGGESERSAADGSASAGSDVAPRLSRRAPGPAAPPAERDARFLGADEAWDIDSGVPPEDVYELP